MKDVLCARCFKRIAQLRFVRPRVAGIERLVMHLVSGSAELVRVRPHRREEQNDLLLVVLLVGTEADVLGHEYRCRFRRRQVL